MSDATSIRRLKPRQLRAEVEKLLAANLQDSDLRDQLQELAPNPAFGGFTWLWGPTLYQRNKVLFRPFLLNHFATWEIHPVRGWHTIRWRGPVGEALEEWFSAVDEADDVELFKRLYAWKSNNNAKQWRQDLIDRFRQARSRHARNTVLAKFDTWPTLNQRSALELYQLDRDATSSFIAKHCREQWSDQRRLWSELFQDALDHDDQELAYTLYRRQVSQKQWETEVLKLAGQVQNPESLVAELERRHPEGWSLKLGNTFFRLIEKRGRDVLPYVMKHVRAVYRSWWGGRDGYQKLVKLSAQREWWDLWTALVRTCSQPEEFNKELRSLLKEGALPDREAIRRLQMLSGVSREWNVGPFALAQVQQLEDETALRLYGRFPDLLRGPYKMHVSMGWYNAYPKLAKTVLGAEDETLIDYLASRAVTRPQSPWMDGKEQVQLAELFSRHYEQLAEDPAEFSRRAVAVLSQVPAYSIWNYNELVRTNRLARLFYERSASTFLEDATGVRDLLEAPEIHSQALAFRVLGLDDPRARELAADNLDLLQAAFLRPLHRKTRALAFHALQNSAVDAATARHVYERARLAMDLPDKRYPKEQLVGLMGRLLHRWPTLRSAREQPVIYGADA